MKVWLPAPRAGSGTDIYTVRLAQALERLGIEALISWFSPYWQFTPAALATWGMPRNVSLIHTSSWYGAGFVRGVPLVLTEHQGVFGPGHRPYRSAAQAWYHNRIIKGRLARDFRRCAAITAVSAAAAEGLKQSFGALPVHTIHNFVDTAVFEPGAYSGRRGPFRLLCVGNFTPLKGSVLLKSLMQQLGPGFELAFTSGLRRSHIGALPPNMRPIGRLLGDAQLVGAYRAADAVIVPSFFEGFGYTALEAMACGKPVIASRTGGLREIVTSATGILCTPGEVAEFAQACHQLAADAPAAQALGQAGRTRAVEHFSEAVIAPHYVALYESLLAARQNI